MLFELCSYSFNTTDDRLMIPKPFAAVCKNDKAIKIYMDINSSLVQTGNFSSYISKVKRSLHFLLFTVRGFGPWNPFV